MSHIYGRLGHWEDNPFRKAFGGGDDELQKKWALYQKGGTLETHKDAKERSALLKIEMEADEKHRQQQLMKMAQGPGMSMTGVSHGGRGMPYGDTAMFNPKAMPPRYISGTRPREEEDKPPGLATFSPYRMYS